MHTKLLIIALAFVLAGCQSYTSQIDAHPVLHDEAFPNYELQSIESAKQVFSLNADMRKFVDRKTQKGDTEKGKLSFLVDAIFKLDDLSLAYNASANTSAKQTFKSRQANCLSLTIMTYSMTQYIGLDAHFQDVLIPEFWTRQNGTTLINKHVNLVVKPQNIDRPFLPRAPLVVDFDPHQDAHRFAVRELSESDILSYFYINKAADYQIAKQASSAYAYLKAAIAQNSKNESAWLNLGVLFSQHGYYEQAKAYYKHALLLKPAYATARENLAIVYKKQGYTHRANVELAKLHKERLSNPFYHIMLGDIAYDENTYKKAIKHYKKAIALNNQQHAFYFSLAKAYYANGDMKNTERYLRAAKRKARGINKEQQYASKIATLIASR